jgi:hypothetical protein
MRSRDPDCYFIKVQPINQCSALHVCCRGGIKTCVLMAIFEKTGPLTNKLVKMSDSSNAPPRHKIMGKSSLHYYIMISKNVVKIARTASCLLIIVFKISYI